ncbi:MAG: hypothetical protein JSS34_00290 [Proteobacteria bacterium]|nr:hypothetical protein [Pseudomonadota bacterium]
MEKVFLIGLEIILLSFLLGGLGMIFIPKIFKTLIPTFKETYLSDFLPFNRILTDNKTIQCRDGKLCRIFKIKGIDLNLKTEEEKSFFVARKQFFFDVMAERGATFRFFTKRERFQIQDFADFENEILQEIHYKWNQQFEACYQTKNYLFVQAANEKEIEEVSKIVCDYLSFFNPQLLENSFQGKDFLESPLLSFLSGLVNFQEHKIYHTQENISEILTCSEVLFNLKKGLIELKEGERSCFYKVLGIRGWGEWAGSEILQEILSLSLEFEILHLCRGLKNLDARTTLRYRLAQENLIFKNNFKIKEFENAIEHLEAGHHALYEHQLTFFIKGTTEKQLEQNTAVLEKILLNYGIKPVHEMDAIEWLWFSKFPGYDEAARPRNLFSNNLATFLFFDESKEGLLKCDWGMGPLRYFKTSQGNAYALQLHVADQKESLAHSLTIAPSGSGKTTFFQHLIGGALRHKKLKTFIFDRFNGMRIFTQALGGDYIDLNSSQDLKLNPFQCEDSNENRFFLSQFILKLGKCHDPLFLEMAERALDILFRLPLQDRILKNVFEFSFDTGSKLKESLFLWACGQYSSFLNGDYDCLNFKSSRLISFEMTEILKNPYISSVLVDYILHRIRSQVRQEASAHLIFIDEAAPMLEDSFFSHQVQTFLREHRKLRGSINLCFQDAQTLLKLPISETILTHCPTLFLFQNVNAKIEDYAPFNLTDSEWQFIKGVSSFSKHLKRGVLLKRSQESLFMDVDIENIGKYMKIYRSGTEPINLMISLKELWGEKWIDHYLEAY